ncbi:MAG: response regulator, partial [Oligoflexia bacterium]|nr:response regulator [Oligoflexia bacterium]
YFQKIDKWLDISVNCINDNYFFVSLKDVSSIKKHQKKAYEIEDMFENIQAVIPGIICRKVFDDNFTISYIGKKKESTCWISAETLKAKGFMDKIYPEDRDIVINEIKSAISNETQTYDVDYRIKVSEEESRWVHEYGYILPKNSNDVRLIDVVILTKSKEGELKKTKTETKTTTETDKIQIEKSLYSDHVLKMASIGNLAAEIAHEVNNPLTIINYNIDFLKETRNVSERDELMKKVEYAVERISTLVSSLKKFARKDAEKLETIDVNQAITEILDLIKAIYQKENVMIKVELNSKKSLIEGNKGGFQQIIMNILNNARDAIKNKNLDKTFGLITIRSEESEDMLKIIIEDNGEGMDEETKSNIFRPHYTTKPLGMGTGLGLSICKSIVSSFKGEISVESIKGIGTSFILQFPLNDKKILPLEKNIKKNEDVTIQGKVLIVDDEEIIIMMLKRHFEKNGFQVSTAADGEVALNKIKNEKFDYIITDIKMPNLSGDVFIEKAREIASTKDTIVIVITGYLDFPQKQKSNIAKYSNACITKPFTNSKLMQVMSDCSKKQMFCHSMLGRGYINKE